MFKCKVCKKSFSRLFNLQSHQNEVHGKTRYTCKECCKTYSRLSAVRRHTIQNHSLNSDNNQLIQDGSGVTTRGKKRKVEEDDDIIRDEQLIKSNRLNDKDITNTKRDDTEISTSANNNEIPSTSYTQNFDKSNLSKVSTKSLHPEVETKSKNNNDSSLSHIQVTDKSKLVKPNLYRTDSNRTLYRDESATVSKSIPSSNSYEEEIDQSFNEFVLPNLNKDELILQNSNSKTIHTHNKEEIEEMFKDSELDPPELDNSPELSSILQRNWGGIKSKLKCRPIQDILNIRVWNPLEPNKNFDGDILNKLVMLWDVTRCRVRINCSIGLILKNRKTSELRYYHSSSNNATIFDSPKMIKDINDLKNLYSELTNIDLRRVGNLQRPNTSWKIAYITNITFYNYKVLKMGKLGSTNYLPQWIKRNKHIISLDKSPSTNKQFTDNLCFFRCLAIKMFCKCKSKCGCTHASEKVSRKLLTDYLQQTRDNNFVDFDGVTYSDLLRLEQIFQITIIVLELTFDGSSNIAWSSGNTYPEKVYLNKFNNHFSYIRNIDGYAKAFSCDVCSAVYSKLYRLNRHVCKPADQTKFIFPGGEFSAPSTIFTEIFKLTGIEVKDDQLLYYPFRITYDIECLLTKENTPDSTKTLSYSSVHEFLSVSVCSNVPGFTSAKCFIRKSATSEKCLFEFVEYLLAISKKAESILLTRFETLFERIEKMIKSSNLIEDRYAHLSFSNPQVYDNRKDLCGIKSTLLDYIRRIPVVGFNSGRYDINVMKGTLFKLISEIEGEKFSFVVKKTNNMTCIQTNRFRFLDIMNFIAPGFSYAQYLKAYGCSAEKGYFPYEWMDSLGKLKQTFLPSRECFSSTLKGTQLSEAEYTVCKEAWNSKKMRNMEDFLKWYNNLDVTPFLEALESQSNIYKTKRIDMLKDAISLPGLAVKWMFEEIDKCKNSNLNHLIGLPPFVISRELLSSQPIYLINNSNKDMYDLIKNGIVGGPSIIFHRYHEIDSTYIRKLKFGKKAKICKKILGMDANALYLWSMDQMMPTGMPIRRKEEDKFKNITEHNHSKTAHGWLDFISKKRGIHIQQFTNGGEFKIGQHGLPVDGYCVETREVFQFHGCYWHGHPCFVNDGVDIHPTRKIPIREIYQETLIKDQYINQLGFTLHTKWECEWNKEISENKEIRDFLRVFNSIFYPNKEAKSLDEVISDITSGRFFGLVECDILVPANLANYFEEMAPIFKNVEVSREDIGMHMKEFAISSNQLKSPQKMLIGSLFGNKILLLSELARWYLNHGLKITRIYQLIEYIPRQIFSPFVSSVTDARRAGDKDEQFKLIADTSKLVGNSAYGKTITNKEKFKTVKYIEGSENASARIRRTNFRSLEELTDEFYEIESSKSTVSNFFFFCKLSSCFLMNVRI